MQTFGLFAYLKKKNQKNMETVGTVAHKGLQKTTLLLITMHELSSIVKEIDLLWLEVPIKIGTLVSNFFFLFLLSRV